MCKPIANTTQIQYCFNSCNKVLYNHIILIFNFTGGFIDNKQQNPIKPPTDSLEMPVMLEQKLLPKEESIANVEQQPRIPNKIRKKQGRQKIRSHSTTSTTTAATTTSTAGTTSTHQFPLESAEQSATIPNIINVNANVPAEVVRQINDSIEIKYNHKQTSRHSIELTAHAHYGDANEHHLHQQQQQHHNHRHHTEDDNDDEADDDDDDSDEGNVSDESVEDETETETSLKLAKTSSGLQLQEDEDVSVIRMNWPADFMDIPLSSSNTTTEMPSDESDDVSSSTKDQQSTDSDADSSELPMTLSALNIPQSLWPKLPGNITKLGSPYATENSLEEPAICVPITVREFNMMNSHEVVNIERVFCFPMPTGTNMGRGTFKSSTSTTMRNIVNHVRNTASPVIRASIQNYEEYFEPHSTNGSSAKYLAYNSQLYLLCYFLVYILNIFIKYE